MSTRQQALSDNYTACTPALGYDECWEIDRADMVTWQDTVVANNTPWRTTSLDIRNQRTDVTINSRELNAHVIPTAPGQGYYDSWEDLEDAIRDLLGTHLFDQGDLVTYGEWVKLDGDDVAFGTTGDFVVDAVSNADGEIWVDGVKVYPDQGGGCDPTVGCLMSAPSSRTRTWGTSEARIRAYRTNLLIYTSLGTAIDRYKRNGKSSYTEFYCRLKPFPYCWYRRHNIVAEHMTLENDWYVKDPYFGNTLARQGVKTSSNTASMTYSSWGIGIPAPINYNWVCGYGTIVDRNGTGEGGVGTSGC